MENPIDNLSLDTVMRRSRLGYVVNQVATFTQSTNHLSTLVGPELSFEYFSLVGMAQPFLDYDPTNYGSIQINGMNGGLNVVGLTANGSTEALAFSAVMGAITTTRPAIFFSTSKADGAGGLAALAASETAFEFNNLGSPLFDVYGNGEVSINGASRTGFSRLNIKSPAPSTGTGTITNGGTKSVVGTGTLFTTELAVGDKMIVGGATVTVTSITDNTHLTVDYFANWVAASFTYVKPVERILNSGGGLTAALYPTGDLAVRALKTSEPISSICFGSLPGTGPQLVFGFGDSTTDHLWRSAGGSNLDVIIDILNGATHFLGIGGLFYTAYGATIGDTTYAIAAPTNGLHVVGEASFGDNVLVGSNTAGANAVKVLALSNSATPPTNSVDLAQIYAADIAAGRATLALFTEEAVAADIGLVTTDSLTVFINGAKYKLGLTLVP